MLGIFLIYWIGKKYYVLAENNNRSPWGFAILGIIIYYSSQFAMGIGLAILMPEMFIGNNNDIMLNVLGIGIGLLVWYLIFQYLESKWENEEEFVEIDEISEIGKDLEG
ncbi:hypothetical protein [Lacihabitans sp. LS3-19]|uniref:hypothetical protein n=1 Tax=Lacihabitans sp. LS3-19 TaxID=2487335 RepID=UPI0020CB9CD8|nr:hypothetical protein [Lacihabitans sp. LS3-19]